MKGDFSRLRFRSKARYSGVLMQQGRLQTDADWNAQAAIAAESQRTALRDLIGRSGGPEGDAGFGVAAFSALKFDGSRDWLEVHADDSGHRREERFTVEGWLRLDRPLRGTIVASHGRPVDFHAWDGFRFGVTDAGRLFCEWIENAALNDVPQTDATQEKGPAGRIVETLAGERFVARRLEGQGALVPGRYHHVALSIGDNLARLFLDGRPEGDMRVEDRRHFTLLPLSIGADTADGSPVHFLDGAIDRLRLWTRDLARAEIQAAMRSDRESPDLLAEWRFGSGLKDCSGKGHHARTGAGHRAAFTNDIRREIRIGGGRYYVDGLLCDAEETKLDPTSAKNGRWLLYLEAAEETVGGAEDPDLIEPALNGLDTSLRVRTSARVLAHELAEGEEPRLPASAPPAEMLVHHDDAVSILDNRLFRVEVLHAGFAKLAADGWSRGLGLAIRRDGEQKDLLHLTLAPGMADSPEVGQQIQFVDGTGKPAGTANVVEVRGSPAGSAIVRLDNVPAIQPDWKARPVAALVWSRDNGGSTARVVEVDSTGKLITIDDVGGAADLFRAPCWVERASPDMTRRQAPIRVEKVEAGRPGRMILSLATALPPALRKPDGIVRIWDEFGPEEDTGRTALHAAVGTQIPLDNGVRVSFGDGLLTAGAYWTIRVRSVGDAVDWTAEGRGPDGGEPRRAELAVLQDDGLQYHVTDLRRLFAPLDDGFLSRRGGTLTGDLSVDGDLTVAGRVQARDIRAKGLVEAREFKGKLPPDSVGPKQILDGSVEWRHLADGMGMVPPDCFVMGTSPNPPPGWAATEERLIVDRPGAQWHPRAAGPPRSGPLLCTVLGDLIYVLWESGELYSFNPAEPPAFAWIERRPAPASHLRGASFVALDGRLHLIGGGARHVTATRRHLVFHPLEDRWEEALPLPEERTKAASVLFDGSIYVIGGRGGQRREIYDSVRHYIPRDDRWTVATPLPVAIQSAAAAVADGRIYLMGGKIPRYFGFDRIIARTMFSFSPAQYRWREEPPMNYARHTSTAAVSGNRLFIVGGLEEGGGTAPIEVYDTSTGRFREAPQFGDELAFGRTVGLHGVIYHVHGGGHSQRGPSVWSCHASTEYYLYRKTIVAGGPLPVFRRRGTSEVE